jgi:NAD(P)-dependent dehydrogenase (short-subunit alcohol dehydrogenase family)
VLEVNLTGAFLGARAASRVMTAGGRIVFTGSVLGERPRAGLTAYSASKAGLVGMAKGLALDLAPAGITVNVVAPGWFDSPLAEGWMNDPDLDAAITGHTAQGRWGASGDLPGAYLFLASDAAAFVTGTVVTVDGGYLLA